MAYDLHFEEHATISLKLFDSRFVNFVHIDRALRWGLSRKPFRCEKNYGTDLRCLKVGPALTEESKAFVITAFFTLEKDNKVRVAYFETREWSDPLDSTGFDDEIWKNLLIAEE